MADIVVITTDDLEPAVRLRSGFQETGLAVELLTAGETLADVPGEPVLAVLTGGLRERRARTLIAAARQRGTLPVIGLIEPTEVPSRERCRQLGISECFAKPVDVDEVVVVGRRLIERERLREITGIIGETEEMEEVLERVVQIAAVDSTVLIEGESGTGKELVARGIHALSRRRHRPFIAVNVAALSETLLESELFGHEKGAFTGAASLRKGLFELAHGGTIFLDEIGEMPPATQTKLLRVLEEREFRRVGGEELLRVDVRVVAATNRDLRQQVELGEFRRDLYHRLNVLRVRLPALRERRADIPLLVEKFVHAFSREHDRPFLGLDPEALHILMEYDWPGNVRELKNLIESMVVLAPGRTIRPEDIPPEVRRTGGGRALLPVLTRQVTGERAQPPELEFVLRTLFDLKMDLDDLRRAFESYRERRSEDSGYPYPGVPLPAAAAGYAPLVGRMPYLLPPGLQPPTVLEEDADEGAEEEQAVVYRAGMTMQDLERQAIEVALRRVRGNRRKAAEELGIG
ncbi:MAG TPA: sigma 54-interacting transcriptional regulator, partial [Longimicrobiaceae bacterium]|nr:sigma 54-interacting transcriptional regulator [Longimicrobiaceae bacterium]